MLIPNKQALVNQRLRRCQSALLRDHILLNEVASRLLDRLQFILHEPLRILVLGVWPDGTVDSLAQRYPKADIVVTSLSEDILQNQTRLACQTLSYQLPFQKGVFDLVFSNCSLSLVSDLAWCFHEIYRVAKEGALLMVSLLGVDTLHELKSSFAGVDALTHVHVHPDMHDIGDLLLQCQWQDPVVDMEHVTIQYESLSDLFTDIKVMAMNNAHQKRCPHLYLKKSWQAMIEKYESWRNHHQTLPATVELIYGHAWRGSDEQGMSLQMADEAIIPLHQISRTKKT